MDLGNRAQELVPEISLLGIIRVFQIQCLDGFSINLHRVEPSMHDRSNTLRDQPERSRLRPERSRRLGRVYQGYSTCRYYPFIQVGDHMWANHKTGCEADNHRAAYDFHNDQ